MTYKQFLVAVPWPDRALSPNARIHWARKAKAAKTARAIAMLKARAWEVTNGPVDPDVSIIRFTAQPKTARRMDDDNLIASLKATRDGIADALGVNDRRFATAPVKWGEPDR
jgi:hypothetical protein